MCRALHTDVERIVASSLRNSPLGQLRVVIVRHDRVSGSLLQSDIFKCWRLGVSLHGKIPNLSRDANDLKRNTVSDCKVT